MSTRTGRCWSCSATALSARAGLTGQPGEQQRQPGAVAQPVAGLDHTVASAVVADQNLGGGGGWPLDLVQIVLYGLIGFAVMRRLPAGNRPPLSAPPQ